MTKTDGKKPKQRPEVEVVNPLYKGATPEMVAHALLQPRPKQDVDDEETR